MPPPLRAAAPFGVEYRPMAEGDYAFVEALYCAIRADEVALSGWPVEHRRQFLLQQHRAQHHHYQTYYPGAEWLIIERGGERIGRLYLAEWSDQVRIVDIALIEGHRGQGLGGAILRDVCAWAAGLGKRASIHVEKNNPARFLYQRLGFAVVEDKGIYDLMEWSGDAAA